MMLLTIIGFSLVLITPAICQWQQVALESCSVYGVVFRPDDCDTCYAGVPWSQAGVYRSIDGGQTWTRISCLGLTDFAIDPINKDNIYAIRIGESVWRSTDGGITWESKEQGLEIIPGVDGPVDIAINPCSPETLYLTTACMTGGGRLYRSPNQASRWYQVEMPWINQKGPIAIDPVNCGRMYVAEGWNGPLGRSLDSGNSWEGILWVPVNDISLAPKNPQIIFAVANGLLYRSTDGGDTWTCLGAESGLAEYLSCVVVNPCNPAIVLAAGGAYVYKSIDGGITWTEFSEGLSDDAYIASIAIDGELGQIALLATYGHGIYRRELSLAWVDDRTSPKGFEPPALCCAPNPFREEAVISYRLPGMCHVILSVYDVSGRLVDRLVDEDLLGGTHVTTWRGMDRVGMPVASGVYFLVLEDGSTRWIKSIVHLR